MVGRAPDINIQVRVSLFIYPFFTFYDNNILQFIDSRRLVSYAIAGEYFSWWSNIRFTRWACACSLDYYQLAYSPARIKRIGRRLGGNCSYTRPKNSRGLTLFSEQVSNLLNTAKVSYELTSSSLCKTRTADRIFNSLSYYSKDPTEVLRLSAKLTKVEQAVCLNGNNFIICNYDSCLLLFVVVTEDPTPICLIWLTDF